MNSEIIDKSRLISLNSQIELTLFHVFISVFAIPSPHFCTLTEGVYRHQIEGVFREKNDSGEMTK